MFWWKSDENDSEKDYTYIYIKKKKRCLMKNIDRQINPIIDAFWVMEIKM